MEKIKIDKIQTPKELYPRDTFDNETVNNYKLNLEKLPPIKVNKELILIDGYHRLLAHKLGGMEEIEVEMLDIPQDRILWESARLNSQHGLQLTNDDKRKLAKIFYANNGCTLKQISEVLAIGESTLSESWLKDDIQEYKEEQKKAIIDLYLQCRTQVEIAKETQLSEGRISQILKKFETEEIKEINLVPESLQYFNVWNFKDRDKKHGLAYEGAIPGQIVENVLYYFTKPFDIVVDPMAGGGTTIDVCRVLYRRYRAYDIISLLPEIIKHDIRDGFPEETKNCDLIFLDPPYFNMVFKDLFKDIQDFYEFLRGIASSAFKTIKTNGIVTLLMQDMTELGNYCLSGKSFTFFEEAGFKTVAHISCPLTTQQFNPQQLEKAKTEKRMLGRNRDLYIFQKGTSG